ncbi:tripartite tricarboxylate transporter substrate binding protein [Caenimonas sedimenti]|uniref:Tripartite tricarboxylate transporter substrate binding protein n=1 Tax=Caenimonas sedimenti TaxID=2596921 RepID=A0A562ZXI0_9BURK|nr:tripartite tricarboxylate transporter substrate binding protein [Caenimonas sedimenti]TWO73173.1 tripartite tricarboxylate transporter substrate binding protein [Caenimonas sedimenti]
MHQLNRRAALAALAGAALPLHAQGTWPTRPVRIVVAYPPGGVSDAVARLLAERLAGPLGQPVVVENKAGASGTIGMDAVAKAAPDGHTLGFSAISPLALNPHLGKSPFDPAKDIVAVASVMFSPVLLLATPATTAKDFRELLAAAQAKPGAVRWATSGPASLGHIMLEQLQASAKVRITHVPYKGGGQQITDALSGQFEVLSVNAGPAVMAHLKAGKLRALAVGAPARLEALPQVPTLAELGHASANLTSLFGVFAPAGTPTAAVERVNAEINKLLAQGDVRSRLLASDNVPTGGSAAEFARQIAAESESNARIVQAAGIKAE